MQARGSKNTEMLVAGEARSVYEAGLQRAWNSLPPGLKLRTEERQPLVVLSPGTWNVEAGPDFLNAKIELEGRVSTGDIELHLRSSDWLRHGHSGDPAYSKVILHVVAEDDRESIKSEPRIPTLVLRGRSKKSAEKRLPPLGRCAGFFERQTSGKLQEMLNDAGRERFREKSDALLKEMLARGSEEAALLFLFDAVGYKANRKNLLELFSRITGQPSSLSDDELCAVLWGESGLLPDPAALALEPEIRELVSATWKKFWPLRKSSHPPIYWQRSGARPLNSPERRIAALAALLRLLGRRPIAFCRDSANLSAPQDYWTDLRGKLVIRDPLWDCRSSFESVPGKASAVFGEDKAIELAVNVLLPALHAWGRIEKKPEWSAFAESAWFFIPAPAPNRIVKLATQRWFGEQHSVASKTLRSSACVQGMLQLYKRYCEKAHADCNACLLFNSL